VFEPETRSAGKDGMLTALRNKLGKIEATESIWRKQTT
jgi:hypothetical protein